MKNKRCSGIRQGQGTIWEGVEPWVLTLVYISICLTQGRAPGQGGHVPPLHPAGILIVGVGLVPLALGDILHRGALAVDTIARACIMGGNSLSLYNNWKSSSSIQTLMQPLKYRLKVRDHIHAISIPGSNLNQFPQTMLPYENTSPATQVWSRGMPLMQR